MKKNKCYDKMNLDGVTDGVTIKLAIFVLTVQKEYIYMIVNQKLESLISTTREETIEKGEKKT